MKIKIVCQNCRKIFYVAYWESKRRKNCSKKCQFISQARKFSKQNNPNWGGGKKFKCLICKKEFWVRPSFIKKGCGKCCSRKCQGIYHRGKSFFKPTEEFKKKLSKIKKALQLTGSKCHMWKGGKILWSDYIFIYKPQHPFCNSGKYVAEHRLIMEKYLGRYLKPEEIVHHINKNTIDNRIENLMLFSNSIEHLKFHRNN